jgi:hypothetical protein
MDVLMVRPSFLHHPDHDSSEVGVEEEAIPAA